MNEENAVVVAPRAPIAPDYTAIEKVKSFAEANKGLIVSDDASYTGALQALAEVRTLSKELEANRKERTQPLDAHKKEIMEAYKPAVDACSAADVALVSVTQRWAREQEAARRKAEQEAAAKAERERQKAEQKAETYREQGREDKAEEWETKARFTPAPVVPAAVPKVAGVSMRDEWRFEVVDKAKLPLNYLIPNETAIGKVVDALKEEHGIPGIRVWCDKVPVTRRAS